MQGIRAKGPLMGEILDPCKKLDGMISNRCRLIPQADQVQTDSRFPEWS
jgi:hypothetical protein